MLTKAMKLGMTGVFHCVHRGVDGKVKDVWPDRAIRNAAKMLTEKGLFIASVLNADDYPALEGEYGRDWEAVPEFDAQGEQPSVEDVVVMCMYDEEAFQRLVWTGFGWVQTWQPTRATTIFGQCKKPRA